MLMLIQLFLRAEYPAEGCPHVGRYLWLCRIAIGIDERAIVFGMTGHEVDEGLKRCTAASDDLDGL